jgi:hypothetical protein
MKYKWNLRENVNEYKESKEFRLFGAENRSPQPCPYDVNTGIRRLTSL